MQKVILKYFNNFKSLNSALLDQVIVSGSNFLLNIFLARFLGVSEFGLFTILWMVVLFVSSIQMGIILSPMLSISSLVIKENKKGYWGTILIHQFLFCLFSFILIISIGLIAPLINKSWDITIYLLPLGLAAFFVQLQDFVRRYLFAINEIKLVLLTDTIRYVFIFPIIFYLNSYSALSVLNVLWIIVVTSLLASIFVFKFKGRLVVNKYSFIRNTKRSWETGKWLTGSALLQWFTGNLFFIVAGSVLGVVSVGVLKAAQSVLGVTHIMLQAFENFLPVEAAKKLKLSKIIFYKYIKKTMIYGGIITLFIGLIISINPNWLFEKIFGESFKNYGYILKFYSIIYVVIFVSFPLKIGLRAIEYTKPIFLSYIWTSILTLIIVYPLINQFDILGAVIGILLTATINSLYLFISFKSKLKELFSPKIVLTNE